LKNKDGKDWFAYKMNFFNLKAYDWVADNFDPVTGTKTGKKNPGGFDAVNIYGDEREGTFDYTRTNKEQPWNYINLGQYHRTGYREVDMVDYNTKNTKANAALHFRLKPNEEQASPELIVASNFGSGTTVYQGDNRFSLKNILFFQNRIEVRKRDKYFFRVFATNENSGDSYDPYFTALFLQQKSKSTGTWGEDYARYWRQVIDRRANNLGYPQLQIVFNPDGSISSKFDQAKADKFIVDNEALFQTWHNEARTYADTVKTAIPFLAPGTQRFNDEFRRVTQTKSGSRNLQTGGTGFYDKSALYHAHGEYRFQPKQYVNEWVVGGNFRLYTPQSRGTIFQDSAIYTQSRLPDGSIRNDTTGYNTITNSEFGLYTGIEKRMVDNKFKFNATIRMDKNQNFGYLFSPAASFVWQPDKVNYVRAIFSSAIRNPTLNDQFLNLNVGRAILSGNTTGFKNLYSVESFVSYIDSNFKQSILFKFDVPPIRPEKVKSLELGYRTTINNKTYVDMSYYYSFYRDFIGYRLGVRSNFDAFGFPKNTQAFRVASNASERVTTQGFSLGINHYIKNLILNGNYSWNVLNTKTTDPIIPAFNTPAHKFNLGVTGRDVRIKDIKNVGFSLNYKWIQGFQFSGSPQFSGAIPSYDLVDGQVNYTFTKINTLLKIGATNMLNKKQYQVYGGPRIGRMAYISLQYEWQKK
jgi:iron complex outermembrane recepter protein